MDIAAYVDSHGDATQAVVAPHLRVEEIRGRSIMIHAGGDNYSDTPKPLAAARALPVVDSLIGVTAAAPGERSSLPGGSHE